MAEAIKKLLEGNVGWVKKTLETDPGFFEGLAREQNPEFLWIGCSDSRVPATQITDTVPGSIFVHRNIANVVLHTDTNLMSVVFYAVTVLKVKHVIVCGHYGCGGVKAAMQNQSFGFLDNWLAQLKQVYTQGETELDGIADENARCDRFVEMNVEAGVRSLARVSFIQEAWSKGEYPYIHGMVYNLADGLLRDLKVTMNSGKDLKKVFRYE